MSEGHNMYPSSNTVIVLNRKDGQNTMHTWCKKQNHTKLVGRSYGKRSHRRPGCRWEDNIKMNLKKYVIKM